jgi:hypothetical protein
MLAGACPFAALAILLPLFEVVLWTYPMEDLVEFSRKPGWMFFLQASPFAGRAFEFNYYYQRMKLPAHLTFNYTFVALFPENMTNPPNLAPPENYLNWKSYKQDNHMWPIRDTATMFWIFQYALVATDARWIYRGYDDILINFGLLVRLMRELDERYDPLTEVVIRGDCIVTSQVYLQGGAGWVFSRRALEMIVPKANYSVWGFWEEFDDVRMGHLFQDLGIEVGLCASSAFLGTRLEDVDVLAAQTGNWTGLPACPDPNVLEQFQCAKFVAPTSQLVFYHVGKGGDGITEAFELRRLSAEHLWFAPPEISFWHDNGYQAHLCYRKNPPPDEPVFTRI